MKPVTNTPSALILALFSRAAFACGVALISVGSPSAHGFTLTSSSDSSMKGWRSHTVQFRLNTSSCPAGIDGILASAMNVWNAVPTSDLTIERGPDTATTYAQLNAGTATDVPVIICDPSFSTHSGVGGNGIAGVALTSSPPTGGNISYAYLLINVETGSSGNISSANPAVVSVVLAHEIGHVLGLGHSQDVNALMYYNASAKNNLSLAQDDVDGISYLYPSAEGLNEKVMGCGLARALYSDDSGPPAGGIGIVALLLALPLVIASVLSRRPRLITR